MQPIPTIWDNMTCYLLYWAKNKCTWLCRMGSNGNFDKYRIDKEDCWNLLTQLKRTKMLSSYQINLKYYKV